MTIKKHTRKYGNKYNASKKHTKRNKKNMKGGSDPQECGVDEDGNKLPDCPEGFRCKKHKKDKRGLCITSQLIIKHNDEELVLNAPEKRHNKWNIELIQDNVNEFIEIRNNSLKYTRNEIDEMIRGLIEQIDDNSLITLTNGATTRDEKIIRFIMLKDILEKQNQKDMPQEIQEEMQDVVEEKQEEKKEEVISEEEKKEDSNQESGVFSFLNTEKKETKLEPLTEEQIKKIDEMQNNLEIYPGDFNENEKNKFLNNVEKKHSEFLKENSNYDEFLYPELDDPNFNIKIAKQKEFHDTQYDGKIYDVKTQAEKMCNAEFELMPHQLFVKNFMSMQTPYNSLLLYHGLGTGKTCSAIGVAEEMRNYYKNIGSNEKIIVVASPNVQNNFKLQLFDERKLKLEGDVWNINSCVGNGLLKEVNPVQIKNVPRAKIISQINTLIQKSYLFVGYVEFASYIQRKTGVDESLELGVQESKELEIENIKKYFNNRLIIIDEVHNISAVQTNKKNKKTAIALAKLCKHAENLRLLVLSATPMYNNHKEIIWLVNLLNSVDKRGQIKEEDVFSKDGTFIEEKTDKNNNVKESGKDLLRRKLMGYVSYIRGENPYTFPFRIYPEDFDNTKALKTIEYPKKQMNNKDIENGIEFVPLYMNKIGSYQSEIYSKVMTETQNKLLGDNTNMPNFEELDSFGYTLLSSPIQCLNITYPSELENIENNIGSVGLREIMNQKIKKTPYMLRYGFEYKPEVIEKYGNIFSLDNIANYSSKIHSICQSIKKSKGIVMIYSQYIDSGVVPMALALEEMGFTRFGTASHTKSLFNNPPSEKIDSLTMKKESEYDSNNFLPAKYVMITGDKYFSPNNASDLKEVTNLENRNGEKIKVVLITKAAAEGLDFKNVRQIHILEPWYNLSRTEQIIGRAVRNLSHCALPFEERNVEIYLHGTLLEDEEKEAVDLYVYRYAEKKAKLIGNVTRLMKETAVDCILNIEQTNMSLEKLNESSQGQEVELSLSSKSTEPIQYKIGDRPYTAICDYMDNCSFICNPDTNLEKMSINKNNYFEEFAKINYPIIVKRIRELLKEKPFYKRDELIKSILQHKEYPIEHIDFALEKLVNNRSEFILDKYGNNGFLINKDDYYAFQPFEITDEYASIYDRSIPIDRKNYALDMELPLKKSDNKKKISDNANINVNSKKEIDETNEIEDVTTRNKLDKIFVDLQNNIQQVKEERDAKNKMESEIGEINKINKRKLAIIRKKYKTDVSDSNWYKNAGIIYDLMKDNYFISEELLEKYFIYHFIDCLELEDQLIIINELYKNSVNGSDIPYYKLIKQYYDDHVLVNGDKKAIILPSDKNVMYVFDNSKQIWLDAKPTEQTLFKQQIIEKFPIPKSKLNNIIGFIYQSKRERLFKIKIFGKDKNNTGVACNSLGKVDILHRLEPILKQNPHNIENWPSYDAETLDEILKPGLCVLLECIMRFYNESNTNTYWFLDSIQALTNNIEKL